MNQRDIINAIANFAKDTSIPEAERGMGMAGILTVADTHFNMLVAGTNPDAEDTAETALRTLKTAALTGRAWFLVTVDIHSEQVTLLSNHTKEIAARLLEAVVAQVDKHSAKE